MNPKVIIEISKELNESILEYQEAYKALHGKRGPSKAATIEDLDYALISALNEKTEEINHIKKQLEQSKA
jgi:hypothetical protein